MGIRLKIILSFTFLLIILQNSQAQGLKKTIKEFTKVMSQSEISQVEFTNKLKRLIDPSANVDSLSIDYFQHWKYNAQMNSYPLKTKIENIEKETKETATAKISNIWLQPTGEKYFFVSETTWVKKDKKWYRTGQPAKIIERRKIN